MKTLLLLTLILLTGCAARVTSSSPRTVVVQAGNMMVAQSQALADAECAKHSRYARLHENSGRSSNRFVFDCVN